MLLHVCVVGEKRGAPASVCEPSQCYEERRSESSRDTVRARGHSKKPQPELSSVRKGSGDSYTESSETKGEESQTGEAQDKHTQP